MKKNRPTFSVRKHVARDSQVMKKYRPIGNGRVVASRHHGPPVAVTEARLDRRPRFLDPYSRQAEEAERQEDAIRQGLEDIRQPWLAVQACFGNRHRRSMVSARDDAPITDG